MENSIRLAGYIEQYWAEVSRRDFHSAEAQTHQQKIYELEMSTIPDLLRELNIQETTMEDGTKIKLGETFTASVANRNQIEAAKILRQIGAQDVMREVVTFEFMGDEVEKCKVITEFASIQEVPFGIESKIHPSTLKKVVRDAMAEGKLNMGDLDTLGVVCTTKATIKARKEG